MNRADELHEKLLKAFNEYFKANLHWELKGTRRAGMDTRFWLAEIRRLCTERRKVIQEWRYDCGKFALREPSKAALERLNQKKDQKDQNVEGKNDN